MSAAKVIYGDAIKCPRCQGPAKPGSRNRVSETHVIYHCAGGHGEFSVEDCGDSVSESLAERVERLEAELVEAQAAVERKRQEDGP